MPTVRFFPLWFLAIVVLGHLALRAELPLARLLTIFPPGGQAGTTVKVEATGVDLDDASQLLFSHTNIVSKLEPADETDESGPRRFSVTIGAEVPTGRVEVRVLGRFGVSNGRAFAVGNRPEIQMPSTNHSPDSPVLLARDTVVNRRLGTNAVDHFKFTANGGQILSLECETRAIDSRMQPVLVVSDLSGRPIARHRRPGPFDFSAPTNGTYLLSVHDVTYRHGSDMFYRLVVSTAPRIDYAFPPAGVAGLANRFTLHGRNLQPGGSMPEPGRTGVSPETLDVEIALPANAWSQPDPLAGLNLPPASAGLDAIAYRHPSRETGSNPVLVGIAASEVIDESEPNDQPEQAQTIKIPCEVVGRFQTSDDRDWSSFEAKKGDVFWIETFSHRLGLPTDPVVLVQRIARGDKGEETASEVLELQDVDSSIGGPGFNTATRDPVGRFEAPADGTYRLCIRNLFRGSDDNPRLVYRLSLRRESPDFRLVALPQAPPPPNRDIREALVGTPFLRRAETIPIRVLAFRRDGFKEPIQLSVEGLPSTIHSGSAQIDAEKSSAQIFLTAESNAPAWFGPIRVSGQASIGGTNVTRDARFAEVSWNVPDYNNEAIQTRFASEMVLAVSDVESAPVTVAPAEARVYEVAAGGKLQVPLRIDRHADFNETLKLKPIGPAAVDSAREVEVAGKTNSATWELDLAQIKLPPGTHTLALQAQTRGKYRNFSNDAKRIEAAAKDAGTAARAARERWERLTTEVARTAQALAAACKAADEAADLVRSATESGRTAADARLQAAVDLKAAAEKAVAVAVTAAKDAEASKTALEKRSKDLEGKTKPRELTITVYSAPITVLVKDTAKP